MLTVHHLENSRSQRVLWLLEELGLPYDVRRHARDPQTMLAPPALLQVHPLGKSPVIADDATGLTVAETGAIVEYLLDACPGTPLRPAPGTPEFLRHRYWLHFAEGSAMLPLMLNLYVGRLGEAGAPLHPRIESELANYLGYLNDVLGHTPYLVGDALSGADIQMSFIGEVAQAQGKLQAYPNLAAWLQKLQARPAYRKAVERGGEYAFAK